MARSRRCARSSASRGGALQERVGGRIEHAAQEVVGRGVADIEADRGVECGEVHEVGGRKLPLSAGGVAVRAAREQLGDRAHRGHLAAGRRPAGRSRGAGRRRAPATALARPRNDEALALVHARRGERENGVRRPASSRRPRSTRSARADGRALEDEQRLVAPAVFPEQPVSSGPGAARGIGSGARANVSPSTTTASGEQAHRAAERRARSSNVRLSLSARTRAGTALPSRDRTARRRARAGRPCAVRARSGPRPIARHPGREGAR